VLESREKLLLSQIEAHAPNQERYSLAAKVCNVGVALLVYVRDDKLAPRITDVQTSWIGCGLGGVMGNKGAVGVRFRLPTEAGGVGETYTFVFFSIILTQFLTSLTALYAPISHLMRRNSSPDSKIGSALSADSSSPQYMAALRPVLSTTPHISSSSAT
jgi:hypothetical protein